MKPEEMSEGLDLRSEDFKWTTAPVIGLLLLNSKIDSFGENINPEKYYYVAKHISGKIVIVEKSEAANIIEIKNK